MRVLRRSSQLLTVGGSVPPPIVALLSFFAGCGQIGFDNLDAGPSDGATAAACALNPDCTGTSFGAPLSVDGQANIYGAGHASPPAAGGRGGGVLPPMIRLPPGIGRVLTMSATGLISVFGEPSTDGPDGFSGDELHAPGYDGLSGYWAQPHAALSAVFLSDAEPMDPPPSDLNSGDLSYETLSPVLHQVFVVGDGLSGTDEGDRQLFFVPDGATRLFFGVSDSPVANGLPGGYYDNVGSFTVTGEIYLPE